MKTRTKGAKLSTVSRGLSRLRDRMSVTVDELLQRRGQRLAVVRDQAGELQRRAPGCWSRIESISARRSCTSVSSVLESRISWVNSPLRSASTWVTVRVADSSCSQLRRRARRWCPRAGPDPAARCAPRRGSRRRSRRAPRRSRPAGRCRGPRPSSTGRRRPRRRRRATPCAPAGSARRGRARRIPRGTSATYLAPSTVSILIAASERSPTKASFTRNSTITAPSSSGRLSTLPTFTPATRTGSSGLEAGGLGELRLVDGPAADQRQRLRVEREEDQRRRSRVRLTAPMVTGLRSRKGLDGAGHQLHTLRCRCRTRGRDAAPAGSRR